MEKRRHGKQKTADRPKPIRRQGKLRAAVAGRAENTSAGNTLANQEKRGIGFNAV